MALDTTLMAGMDASHLRVFHALRVELIDGGDINLIDGSGFVSFNVDGETVTFTGRNETFGTLANLSTITEAVATEAPRLTVTLLPPGTEGLGTLAAVQNQGSLVKLWFGLINEITGQAIGVPELIWFGRLDTVKVTTGVGVRAVELDVSTVFDRLFPTEEACRLNDLWHQSIWPGETGLSRVIEATLNVPWGMDAARPTVISGRSVSRTTTGTTGGSTTGGGPGRPAWTDTSWTTLTGRTGIGPEQF
ncbi:hypothetical protein Q0812_10370 [Brevundimonas sp. 2R-24]|uniref:Minor tail protein n=1 Tax=Peiella sedimenti TaxID=3061083 RepID=A0ABT8SMN0_9CAUL|nr:hypothetical protein [Caulobacteraceae bacterium XZ-24]